MLNYSLSVSLNYYSSNFTYLRAVIPEKRGGVRKNAGRPRKRQASGANLQESTELETSENDNQCEINVGLISAYLIDLN